jgi:hypothetical protein
MAAHQTALCLSPRLLDMVNQIDIRVWLANLGLEVYAENFQINAVDGSVLADLTESDLVELGVDKIGNRCKLMRAIELLNQSTLPVATAPEDEAYTLQTTERRQITIMFCDLVGSTALSHQFDPEIMSEILSDYQTACGSIILSFDGYVAQYLGDGIVAYFGYPQAQEDEAVQAVRAGLAIAAAIATLQTQAQTPLAVRVGIASGLVIPGKVGRNRASKDQSRHRQHAELSRPPAIHCAPERGGDQRQHEGTDRRTL